MRLLAIDTTFAACSVGVSADDARPAVILSEVIGRGHAERLLGMVYAAMAAAGLSIADLEPGARKRKRRSYDFFQAEDLAIELF